MLLLCAIVSIELLVYREYHRRLVCRLDGNALFLFQNRRIPFYLKNQPSNRPTQHNDRQRN